jgi:hypothetical protein
MAARPDVVSACVHSPSYLRLRRIKLSLKDFRTVKVIGKGAFGEVSSEHASLSHPSYL